MTSRTVEQELLELEKQYWQAIKDKDANAAMRLSDDPCIVAGGQGVGRIDRQTLAGMLTAAPYTLHDFTVSDDVHVRLLRDDVAILAYKVHEELTVDGKPVSLDAADSSTWVRRDGSWVCALHTEAVLGDPFGRDRRDAHR
jgi:ketosteroid isomerase-like protein